MCVLDVDGAVLVNGSVNPRNSGSHTAAIQARSSIALIGALPPLLAGVLDGITHRALRYHLQIVGVQPVLDLFQRKLPVCPPRQLRPLKRGWAIGAADHLVLRAAFHSRGVSDAGSVPSAIL
jgi:hypothetical protein